MLNIVRPTSRVFAGLALAMMSAGTVLLLTIAGTATVLADCDAMGDGPGGPSQVRGTSWVGTYQGMSGTGDHRVQHWLVSEPISGAPGRHLAYPGGGCHPVTFTPGAIYLVSTANIAAPSNKDTIAYRYLGDGRVALALLGLDDSRFPGLWPREATFQRVASMIEPGFDEKLPATDAEVGTNATHLPGPPALQALLILVAGAIGFLGAAARLRTRARRAR
jgi:hypothetical protein